MIQFKVEGLHFSLVARLSEPELKRGGTQPARSPQSLTESELASPSTDLAVRKQRTEQKFIQFKIF